MSTSWSPFDFSHAAFASSVLASPGRMSYLSKSKLMSFRSATATKSRGDGRAVAAAGGAVAAAAGGVAGAAGAIAAGPVGASAVGGVDVAAPVGAGADAAVVAGRFAHPAAAVSATSSDTT